MKLYTSIPAQLRGEVLAESCATSLQKRVINSWLGAGFTPVSINTPHELTASPLLAEALHNLRVESLVVDGSPDGRRPFLPNLRASLEAMCDDSDSECFAIANADIAISSPGIASSIQSGITPSEFRLAHRTDVVAWEEGTPEKCDSSRAMPGRPYSGGFDFFVVGRQQLVATMPLLSNDLALGLPWWDVMLPLALIGAGYEPRALPPRHFQHVSHEIAWSREEFTRVGAKATREFFAKCQGPKLPLSLQIWTLAYKQLSSPIHHPRVWVGCSFESLASDALYWFLKRLAQISTFIVDRDVDSRLWRFTGIELDVVQETETTYVGLPCETLDG